MVHRYRTRGMSRWKFRELADAFNIRLGERTADVIHLVCWAHSHLDRYLLPPRSRGGVHFDQERGGGLRFYLYLRRAVTHGWQVLKKLQNNWVYRDLRCQCLDQLYNTVSESHAHTQCCSASSLVGGLNLWTLVTYCWANHHVMYCLLTVPVTHFTLMT